MGIRVHWIPWLVALLAFSAVVAGLAMLYAQNPEGRTFLPACQFRAITGLHCPGCGATRATHHLLHGRLGTAFYYNPLYVSLLPGLLLWGAWWLRTWWRGQPLTPWQVRSQVWLGGSLLALIICFWVVRNRADWPWW